MFPSRESPGPWLSLVETLRLVGSGVLLRPRDERVSQRLVGGASFLGIQVQTSIEEIDEEIQLFELGITHPFRIDHQTRFEISGRFREVQYPNDILATPLFSAEFDE